MKLLRPNEQLGEFIKQSNVVYISRVAYPVIPLAKRYGKRVIVHLHNFQPITYCSVISHNNGGSLNVPCDMIRSAKFEILENRSVIKSILSTLMTPLNRLVRSWIAKADLILCVSKRQAEIIRYKLPELTEKIKVIYNPPPDIPMIEKGIHEPAFLYVGGNSYFKGFHILMKATASLLRKRNDVKFLLAGNFSKASRQVINSLNRRFNNAYKILGWLPREKLLKLHSTVDGLIFPSLLEEPLPYAVVESMLAGTIPIASRVGGVPEIVQGTYAERMLFTPGDSGELTERMEEILSLSMEQLINIGITLRENTLRKFDADVIRGQLLKFFTFKMA
jgi:glycosyltransferase involved in cell wall biosynthesis